MKIAEINNMNDEDLTQKLSGLREQVRDMRFRIYSKEVKNNHQMKVVKRDIARILTVLTQRQELKK